MSKGALLDVLSAVGLMLLGLFIVWEGLNLGLISQGAPGAGFFPLIMGTGIAMLSAVNAIRAVKIRQISIDLSPAELIKVSICILSLILFIIISQYIGMIVAVFVMSVIVGLVYEGISFKKVSISIVIASFVSALSYLIFSTVLSVPLL